MSRNRAQDLSATCLSIPIVVRKVVVLLLIPLVLALLGSGQVLASAPTLPARLYGRVQFSGTNLPAGTTVVAWINGVPFAQTSTIANEGNSVYIIDIPADDPATPQIEGGREGDTIVWLVDGYLAEQVGIWHSGAIDELPLSATPPPTPPHALDQIAVTDEDTALPLYLQATDVNNDALTFTVVFSPVHGTLTGIPPALTYHPTPNYYGPDNLTFIADDGTFPSNVATVSITVTSVPDVPQIEAIDVQVVSEGYTHIVTVTASDGDGDALALTRSNLPAFAAFTDNGDGTGQLLLKPWFEDAGTYADVQVHASDGTHETTATFTVIVNDAAPSVDLAIEKRADTEWVEPEQFLSYIITVSNILTDDVSGVVISDTLPFFITFVSASHGGAEANGVVTWPPTEVATGEQITRALTVRVADYLPAGVEVLTNTASVSDDGAHGGDANLTDNQVVFTTTLHAAPDLTVGKRTTGATTIPGAIVSYLLTPQNVGNQGASGVVITETVPEYTTYVAASSTPGWSCADGAPSGALCRLNLGSLSVGQDALAMFALQIASPLPPGITAITNTVRIGDDGGNGIDLNPSNNQTTDVSTIYAGPDLTVPSVMWGTTSTDLQSLAISGALDAEVRNAGNQAMTDSFQVTAFEDRNGDETYEPGVDNLLGQVERSSSIAAGASIAFSVPVAGTVSFAGSPVSIFADSQNNVNELIEDNNVNSTASVCEYVPPVGSFTPQVELHWTGGDVSSTSNQSTSTPLVVNLTDDNGDGKINEDDVPEIVFVSFGTGASRMLRAISGDNGHSVFDVPAVQHPKLGAFSLSPSGLAVGDIDNDGLPEILSTGNNYRPNYVAAFEHDGTFKWFSAGYSTNPYNTNTTRDNPTIADLDQDGVPEIIVGNYVFNNDGSLRWRGSGGSAFQSGNNSPSVYGGSISIVADLDLNGDLEVVTGNTAYRANGSIYWQIPYSDGYPAIGNFDHDEYPEIVVVAHGYVRLHDHDGTIKWGPYALPGSGDEAGGAPTVADFDADGEPEIGIAGSNRYAVYETNGILKWQSTTQDLSSNMTGSTVFDLDGDGSYEVIYRDERRLRIYRGSDGFVFYNYIVSSATVNEEPVVADVDNDGNAEIVVSSDLASNVSIPASQRTYGVYIFGDAADTWVPARRIWNQHAYHVDNVNEDGTIPQEQAKSWLTHNTYRSNVPIPLNPYAAPDLTVSKIDFDFSTMPVALTVTFRVGNGGAVRVGPDIPVAVYDGDPAAGGTLLGSLPMNQRLEPGSYTDLAFNWPTPLAGLHDIYVVVDDDGSGVGKANECRETNNMHHRTVEVDSSAVLSVAKTASTDAVGAGQTITYTLSVANLGYSPTGSLVMTDVLPVPTTFVTASTPSIESSGVVTWVVNSLQAREAVTETLTLRVVDALPEGTREITNTMLVRDDAGNVYQTQTITRILRPKLLVGKDDERTSVTPGELLTYTLSVWNVGELPANSVVLTDVLPAHTTFVDASLGGVETGGYVEWHIGGVAVAETVSRSVTIKVADYVPAGVDTLTNLATVTHDGLSAADPVQDIDTIVADPVLVLQHDDGQHAVTPGTLITYTSVVGNTGNRTAAGVVLTATLPSHAQFVSASEGAEILDRVIVWQIGDVTPADPVTKSLVVKLDASAPADLFSITSEAAVRDRIGNLAIDSDEDSVVASPVLAVENDDGITSVEPGDLVTYTLIVGNIGNRNLTSTVLQDRLPQYTSYVAASAGGIYTNGVVSWNLPELVARETKRYTLTVKVADTVPATLGIIINSALARDTSTVAGDVDIDQVVANTLLTLTKDDDLLVVSPGEVFTYTLVASNFGNRDAAAVVLKDQLPAHVSFVRASDSGNEAQGLVTWSSINLAGQEIMTRSVTVRLDDLLPASVHAITNTATVADLYTLVAAVDSDKVLAALDLRVVKSTNRLVATPGGVITYAIVYSNVGLQGATGVVITETMPAHTTASIIGGWDCDGSTGAQCTFLVGELPPGTSGAISFTVTVDNPLQGEVSEIANTVRIGDDGINGADQNPIDNQTSVSTPVNHPPIAVDDAITTTKDFPVVIDVLANDSDLEEDALLITAVGTTIHGAVTTDGATIIYTPTQNFSGTDIFTYTVSDSHDNASARVTVTVKASNKAPTAQDDVTSTPENTPVVIPVLDNDTDPDGDKLVITAVGITPAGTVTTDGATITYAPAPGFTGEASFSYTISDGMLTDTATVTVTVTSLHEAPVVTTQPSNQTVCADSSVTFAAEASGAPTPSVQWQVSSDSGATWNDVSGATVTMLTFIVTASEHGNHYHAIFTNPAGTATSDVATLTVNTRPVITVQPANQMVNAGQSVNFSAAATGNPLPNIQWQVSSDSGATWSDIPDATATTLTFTATASDSGKQYRAVFTNTCNTAVSDPAMLTVNPTPANILLFSSNENRRAGGLVYRDEDIIAYDPNTNQVTMVFDGSDVGLGNNDIDDFAILPNGDILLSLERDFTLNNFGRVGDEDILRFIPITLGDSTKGSYQLYFDGSDVGLGSCDDDGDVNAADLDAGLCDCSDDEDVKGVDLDAEGNLVISVRGKFSALGVVGDDKDLFVFHATQLGKHTQGSWQFLFDGSDVKLTNSTEDVRSVWSDHHTGEIYLTTDGNFSVTGTNGVWSGDGNDILICKPGSLGAKTSCEFRLYMDVGQLGLVREWVDGVSIGVIPVRSMLDASEMGIVVADDTVEFPGDDADEANDPDSESTDDDMHYFIYLALISQ